MEAGGGLLLTSGSYAVLHQSVLKCLGLFENKSILTSIPSQKKPLLYQGQRVGLQDLTQQLQHLRREEKKPNRVIIWGFEQVFH